jgi:hypothetical protein
MNSRRNREMEQMQRYVTDEEAKQCITTVVECEKPNGKVFYSKLIAIEDRYFVFETRDRQVKRNLKHFIISMRTVG